MAWTTPKTFSAAAVLTAAELNTHLRDNLNETCPATVTTAGDIAYADAANSMGNRLAIGADNSYLVSDGSDPVWRQGQSDSDTTNSATLTNTSYLALASVTGGTALPADVAVTVTTGDTALVHVSGMCQNNTGGALTYLSYSVSGASTVSASNGNGIWYEASNANDRAKFGHTVAQALTAGSNTFTLAAQVSSGTGTIAEARITVLPL